jgi:hypothetical protein
LKFVVYHLVVPFIKLKKGIMSYKSTHGIFAFKHFEINHQFEFGINGLNKRKMGLKSKEKFLEKVLALNPIYYFFFLCNNNFYTKDKPH